MHPDHDPLAAAWDAAIKAHEESLTVGVQVMVLPRPECYYCRAGQDEDGMIGVIEHVGYRTYRQVSETREPGEREHIYWVKFPEEIPSSGTYHSHFAAPELSILTSDRQAGQARPWERGEG